MVLLHTGNEPMAQIRRENSSRNQNKSTETKSVLFQILDLNSRLWTGTQLQNFTQTGSDCRHNVPIKCHPVSPAGDVVSTH